ISPLRLNGFDGLGGGTLPVAEQPAFNSLLRSLRISAGFTQEDLAETARLSPRTISDLERGISRGARPQTARLLAAALDLRGLQRSQFLAAAAGRGGADMPTAEPGWPVISAAASTRALPADVRGFTGRASEVGRLMTWAAGPVVEVHQIVAICAIGGMPGIGKTALAVHAAHLLAPRYPDGQFFLPLHAHTPGRRPVDPADAL